MSKLQRARKPKKYLEKIIDDHTHSLVKYVSSPMYIPDLSRETLEKIQSERKWAKFAADFQQKPRDIVEEEPPLGDSDSSIVLGDVYEPMDADMGTFRVTKVDAKSHTAFCTKARKAKFSDLLNPNLYCRVVRGAREKRLNENGNNSLIISQMDTSPSALNKGSSSNVIDVPDIVVKAIDKNNGPNIYKLVDLPNVEPNEPSPPESPVLIPGDVDQLSFTNHLRSDQSLMSCMTSNEDKVPFIYQKSCEMLAIQPAARTVVRQLRKCVPSERFDSLDDDASVGSQVNALSCGGPGDYYNSTATYKSTAVSLDRGSSLSLRNLSLGSVQSCAVLKSVQVLETLQEIDLTGNRLNEAGAVATIKSLRNVTGLHSIILDSNKIGKKGVLALVALLEHRPLDVYDEMLRNRWASGEDEGSVGTASSSWMGSAYSSCVGAPSPPRSTEHSRTYSGMRPSPLNLGVGGGSGDSVASMSTMNTWNSMSSASIFQSPIPTGGGSQVSSSYKTGGSRLSPLGKAGAASLASHRGQGQPLELFASDNSVAGDSVASIPDSISAPAPALRKVFLNDNQLGDLLVAKLVKCLTITCAGTLTELGIRNNQCGVKTTGALTLLITGQPAAHLNTPLRSPKGEQKPPENTLPNCQLRYLDLGWNSFPDGAVMSIFGASGGLFAVPTYLEILLLDWNGISGKCLPLLERLVLGNVPGGTVTMKHLSLENNPTPVPLLQTLAARAEAVQCKLSYSSFHFEQSTFNKLVIQKPKPARTGSILVNSPKRSGSMAVTPSKKR